MDLLKSIHEAKVAETQLKMKINEVIYNKLLNGIEVVDVDFIGLSHKVYDRPIKYLKAEMGHVEAWTSKGYYCLLKELPMDDQVILIKFFEL